MNNNTIGFNSFIIEDCLGEGSFGKVFKVRMKSNGEIYAMKVLNVNIALFSSFNNFFLVISLKEYAYFLIVI